MLIFILFGTSGSLLTFLMEKVFFYLCLWNQGSIHKLTCSSIASNVAPTLADKLTHQFYHRLVLQEVIEDSFPKLKRKAPKVVVKGPAIKILQFSDIHLDLNYSLTGNPNCKQALCCRGSGSTSRPLGEPLCDAPKGLLKAATEYASSLQYDLVVVSGDNSAHNQWQKNQLSISKVNEEVLGELRESLGAPVVFALGNNEYYPDHQTSPFAGQLVRNRLVPLLNITTPAFVQCGYYAREIPRLGVKVVSLNSQGCDVMSFVGAREYQSACQQLPWLQRELEQSSLKQQAVYVVGHLPPTSYSCHSAYSAALLYLLAQYDDVIKGRFFGHQHRDYFVGHHNEKGKVVGYSTISPAFSPFKNNISTFRVHSTDSTGALVDYQQYILRIKDAKPTYAPHYKFSELFGLQLLPENHEWLVRALLHQEDIPKRYLGIYFSGQGNRTAEGYFKDWCVVFQDWARRKQCEKTGRPRFYQLLQMYLG